MSDEDGFYKRWSRRKVAEAEKPEQRTTWAVPPPPEPEAERGAAEDGDTALQPEVPGKGDVQADQAEGDTTDAPSPEADLPDVESLDYDSDYLGFMAEGVSEDLRKRALRRLWRSNPILANVDGLNDYDEDFTDAALVLPGLKTAFDAVRGYAPQEEEEADDAEEAAETGPVTAARSKSSTAR